MKLVLLLLLLIAIVNAQPSLPDSLLHLPRNYTYTIKSVSMIESDAPPNVLSVRDLNGFIYSCFVMALPFVLGNNTYNPSGTNTFLVKMSPLLKVVYVKEYTEIASTECKKMIFDKKEQNVYLELQNFQIAKVNILTGNATLVWTRQERITSWDIVDDERLILVSHVIASPPIITPLFANECPNTPVSEYIAMGIVDTATQSLVSYQCFTNGDKTLIPFHISYINGKIYLFGSFTNQLLLFDALVTGKLGEETAFLARLDWNQNKTEFAMPMGYYGAFSQIQFDKDYSRVTFAIHNRGVASIFGRTFAASVFIFQLALLSESKNPQLISYSKDFTLSGDVSSAQFVSGVNSNDPDSPFIVLYRYQNYPNYDLGLIPVEHGITSNIKIYPMKMSSGDLEVHAVILHNNTKEFTLVFRSLNNSFVTEIGSSFPAQTTFVTMVLPDVKISLPEPVLVSQYENLEASFPNLVSNGTRFVITEGNITLRTDFGVFLVLSNQTYIETTDAFLNIDLYESNLFLSSYNQTFVPAEWNVLGDGTSGQVVGNGYKLTSNGQIFRAQICISNTAVKLQRSTYQIPAIATLTAGSLKVNRQYEVVKNGNQFCTIVGSHETIYPAMMEAKAQPQTSKTITSFAIISNFSFAFLLILISIFF